MNNIIFLSGGKDSSVMLLKMIELNIPIDKIVFADTTLEFPEMYEWIDFLEKKINKKIIRLKPKYNIDEWLYGKFTKGMNKGRIRGLPLSFGKHCHLRGAFKCNQLSKLSKKGSKLFIGIAYDEKHRAEYKTYSKGNYKFPLVEWKMTEQDCVDYLKENNFPFPFFDVKRTGCWLCPQQNKQSLKVLCLKYPLLWNKLKQYEKDSPQGFKPNFSLEKFEKEVGFRK